jgi:hypothetical protein
LANVDSEEAEKLRQNLIKRFGTVQFEVSGRLSYLGMQIEMKETGTVIDRCTGQSVTGYEVYLYDSRKRYGISRG